MVFSTLALPKTSDSSLRTPYRGLVVALLFYFTPATGFADNFFITGIHTRLQDDVYLLSANIEYRLTENVIEALNNGVPITVQLNIEIQRKRRWWLDVDMAALEQRYQLRYHALSHQYLVQNINSGAFYAFPNLDAALDNLGELKDFPLLDKQLVEEGEEYEILLHTELDIEALPSPLRPLAYITPAWRLDSDWYTWSLTP